MGLRALSISAKLAANTRVPSSAGVTSLLVLRTYAAYAGAVIFLIVVGVVGGLFPTLRTVIPEVPIYKLPSDGFSSTKSSFIQYQTLAEVFINNIGVDHLSAVPVHINIETRDFADVWARGFNDSLQETRFYLYTLQVHRGG